MQLNIMKGKNMNNEIMIKQQGETFGGEVSFSDFCRQDTQGIFRIANKETFFKSVTVFNPLRELSTVIKTDCDSIEMPIFDRTNHGWADDPATASPIKDNTVVNIKLYPLYSKLKLSRSMFAKVADLEEYLKKQLQLQLVNLEKKVLLQGKKVSGSAVQYSPVGLVELVQKLQNNGNDTELFFKEINDTDNSKQIPAFDNFSSVLSSLIFDVPAEYHYNAVFAMPLKVLQKISNLSWDQKTLIGFDGVSKLLGYKIVILDELEDHVLFGNFKDAVVIAESDMNYIESHRDFNTPNYIGLSMPSSIGISIINGEALRGVKCVDL